MKRFMILGAMAMSFCGSALAASEGCVVSGVLGEVTVMREGQSMPIKQGDALKKGDSIQTSPACQVDMSMNSLAACRVLSGSEVKIMGWKQENMSLKVESGNVILNLKELPATSSFRVETPTAVATVRGTQFWGRVNPSGDSSMTTFAVRKGSVEITPLENTGAAPVTITPGQAIDIAKGSGVYAVRDALPEEMAAMEQADQISV